MRKACYFPPCYNLSSNNLPEHGTDRILASDKARKSILSRFYLLIIAATFSNDRRNTLPPFDAFVVIFAVKHDFAQQLFW